MAESFEYAIRKDVKNNPIVREVDEARHRDLWRSAGFASLFVALLLGWAWQQFELLQNGYRIEQMQREKAEQEDITRRLRLDIQMLTAPQRIEEFATKKLHLVAPSQEEAIVIERVVPAEPPAKSVVARR